MSRSRPWTGTRKLSWLDPIRGRISLASPRTSLGARRAVRITRGCSPPRGRYRAARRRSCRLASGTRPGRRGVAVTDSRFGMTELEDLPDDLRERVGVIAEKSGFVPNIFRALGHRPAELRAFLDYHDALMDRSDGLTKAER